MIEERSGVSNVFERIKEIKKISNTNERTKVEDINMYAIANRREDKDQMLILT